MTALGEEPKECTQTLMVHTFGWSYGQPFVGNYTPPTNCNWTNVVFNLSMTSAGRQFDRLAHLFLGDIEVWRTSTAEPNPTGIIFNYTKDMTHLSSLLRQPQKIIFDLGNLLNEIYTGSFTATLTATYYSPHQFTPLNPAAEILPISAEKSSEKQPSHFHLPTDKAVTTPKLPPNTIRAVVALHASGNADEEFWYTNVPDEYTSAFPGTSLLGHGPFREIQLLIDGQVAGFVWPFTTVFTGGIVPSLWRPIVAPTAYDLPEYEIDISPFLPKLLDGRDHEIEIAVLSYDSSSNSVQRSIGTDWLVSGRIHIWKDEDPDWKTTGTTQQYLSSPPLFQYLPNLISNVSLDVALSASRNLYTSSLLYTSSGPVPATWIQTLSYSSIMTLKDQGNTQYVKTWTKGSESTVSFGSRSYLYSPLIFNTTFIPGASSFGLEANVEVGHNQRFQGKWTDGVRLDESGKMATVLKGQAVWNSTRGGNGTTEQTWGEVKRVANNEAVGSYGRKVKASGDKVTGDYARINGILVTEDDEEAAREVERILEFGR
ncbi:peptide-N4-(N-acetyl-beta-D-glucosaminyl) asparaginase amidase N [Pyronema domesticum]|nr:peptide-N4-(N-acetyl-beta-D-glucosaminyl) asparaginase amidase N [Pyronema domesticum]